MKKYYSKETLAAKYFPSYKVFISQLKAMLSDESIKSEFGIYAGRCFTQKQLQIIERELGVKIE